VPSKHAKDSDALVARVKKAREELSAALDLNFKESQRIAVEQARKKLETAMFNFGMHRSEYACTCHFRLEEPLTPHLVPVPPPPMRKCEGCGITLMPDHPAVYCTNECAAADA
jgi:hypothetical protein